MASHGGYLAPFFAEAGVGTTVIEPDRERAASFGQRGGRVVHLDVDRVGHGDGPLAGSVELFVDHYLLAHLDAPDAALAAIARLLRPDGVAVLEFDHLLPTVLGMQFDSFRHGHRVYLSLTWLESAARRHGLAVTEAHRQAVYGGALRVAMRPLAGPRPSVDPTVGRIRRAEARAGLADGASLRAFGAAVAALRTETRRLLTQAASDHLSIAAYGAPARAVTLLNYYGLGPEILDFTADASPVKQGRFVPGVRLPIRAPGDLLAARPARVLVLTWDIAREVTEQLAQVRDWGGRFLVPLPHLTEV
jgi:SAM-dependent methyltransferase